MYRRIWGQLSPPFFQEFLSDAANLQGTTSFPCDSTIRPSRKRFISGKSLKRGRKKPSRFYYLTAFPSRRSPFPYPRFLLYTPSARKPSPIKNPASLRKAGYGKKRLREEVLPGALQKSRAGERKYGHWAGWESPCP